MLSHMCKVVVFKKYEFWTFLAYVSACYGVNLQGIHSIRVINSEPNNQFSPLQAE
jgi:hypothetical protein